MTILLGNLAGTVARFYELYNGISIIGFGVMVYMMNRSFMDRERF